MARYRWAAYPSHRRKGNVPSDELDLLAESFVRADAKVYWNCPAHWFSTSEVHTSESAERAGSSDAEPEPRQTVAARVVSPAIRRWGSARVVRLKPSFWSDIYARSTELGGEAGGALLRGLLDSIVALPAKVGTLVRTKALKSGRSDVRHAALHQIAAMDWSLAQMLGRRDANERVRRWASGLKGPTDAQDPNNRNNQHLQPNLAEYLLNGSGFTFRLATNTVK